MRATSGKYPFPGGRPRSALERRSMRTSTASSSSLVPHFMALGLGTSSGGPPPGNAQDRASTGTALYRATTPPSVSEGCPSPEPDNNEIARTLDIPRPANNDTAVASNHTAGEGLHTSGVNSHTADEGLHISSDHLHTAGGNLYSGGRSGMSDRIDPLDPLDPDKDLDEDDEDDDDDIEQLFLEIVCRRRTTSASNNTAGGNLNTTGETVYTSDNGISMDDSDDEDGAVVCVEDSKTNHDEGPSVANEASSAGPAVLQSVDDFILAAKRSLPRELAIEVAGYLQSLPDDQNVSVKYDKNTGGFRYYDYGDGNRVAYLDPLQDHARYLVDGDVLLSNWALGFHFFRLQDLLKWLKWIGKENRRRLRRIIMRFTPKQESVKDFIEVLLLLGDSLSLEYFKIMLRPAHGKSVDFANTEWVEVVQDLRLRGENKYFGLLLDPQRPRRYPNISRPNPADDGVVAQLEGLLRMVICEGKEPRNNEPAYQEGSNDKRRREVAAMHPGPHKRSSILFRWTWAEPVSVSGLQGKASTKNKSAQRIAAPLSASANTSTIPDQPQSTVLQATQQSILDGGPQVPSIVGSSGKRKHPDEGGGDRKRPRKVSDDGN